MSSVNIRKTLEDYFSTMSSISRKLMEDVKNQDHDWNNLSYEETSDIKWRSLVEKSVEEKYLNVDQIEQPYQCFPVFLIDTGEKLVIDEDTSNGRPFGSSWKDEHSSPFLWETKSQLNLHLLVNENIDNPDGVPRTPKTPRTPPSMRSIKKYPTPKATPKSSPKPSPALTRKQLKPTLDEMPTIKPKQNQVLNTTILTLNVPDTSEINLKTDTNSSECALKKEQPIEESPAPIENMKKLAIIAQETQFENIVPKLVESHEEDTVSTTSVDQDLDSPAKSIPKTGFDFLDNW